MPQVSYDNPFYFLTSVTHDRLPVFQTDKLKTVLAAAFDEARRSSGCLFFAYAFMLYHYHIITDDCLKLSAILRYLNGISARRVIDYLRENNFESSLRKLRRENASKDGRTYSLWQPHPNKFRITTESVLMQKVHYIHQNPVEEWTCRKGRRLSLFERSILARPSG